MPAARAPGCAWCLALSLAVLAGGVGQSTGTAESHTVKSTGDTDGSCHYELRVPAATCQGCKCALDSDDKLVSELADRLSAIEKQLPQFLRKKESRQLPTDLTMFADEGAPPLRPTTPETQIPGGDDRASGAGIGSPGATSPGRGDVPANPPGTVGRLGAAQGEERVSNDRAPTTAATEVESATKVPPPAVKRPKQKGGKTGRGLPLLPSEPPRAAEGAFYRTPAPPALASTTTSRPTGPPPQPAAATAPPPQPAAATAPRPPALVGDDEAGWNARPRWRSLDAAGAGRPEAAAEEGGHEGGGGPRRAKLPHARPLGRVGARCVDGCSCLRAWGYWQSGVYDVSNPPASGVEGEYVRAFCDMATDGGGWTVIQNRVDGSRNFYRKWSSYADGFGRLESEFWLGNNLLHGLTTRIDYQLRVEFSDWEGAEGYAVYDRFRVASGAEDFRLTLGDFLAGSHGDALSYHNGSRFSTYDRDNDDSKEASCARLRQAGFWFRACNQANPNGRYVHGPAGAGLNGALIAWGPWAGHGYGYALRTFRMMTRPVHYDSILHYRP